MSTPINPNHLALLPLWRRAHGVPAEQYSCSLTTLNIVKSFEKFRSVPLQVLKKPIIITIRSMNIFVLSISCFADRSSMGFFRFCQGLERRKFSKVFIYCLTPSINARLKVLPLLKDWGIVRFGGRFFHRKMEYSRLRLIELMKGPVPFIYFLDGHNYAPISAPAGQIVNPISNDLAIGEFRLRLNMLACSILDDLREVLNVQKTLVDLQLIAFLANGECRMRLNMLACSISYDLHERLSK